MVNRCCPKCNAIFDRKSSYDKHLNKKFDCSQNKNTNIKIDNNLPIFAEICQNEKKPIKEQNNLNTDNLDSVNLSCSYCNKNYSSKYTLARHVNGNCKIKKENDNQKENIFKLLLDKDKQNKEEINELKKQNKLLMDKLDKLIKTNNKIKPSKIINNQQITNNNNLITNTTNTINTQNNIVMVNFGKEDLNIIVNKIFLERVIKNNLISGVKIPDEILKIIHFNPLYPQLSNIYISDINREKCMVWEDGEWKLSSVDKIPEIMDRVVLFSTNTINKFRTKYPNNQNLNDRLNTIEKYTNMIDSEFIEELKEDDNNENINNNFIKRCEDFQKKTYNTFKTTLYNEGKKLKKNF